MALLFQFIKKVFFFSSGVEDILHNEFVIIFSLSQYGKF